MQVKWLSVGRLIVLGTSLVLLAASLGFGSHTEAAELAQAPSGVGKIIGIDDGGTVSQSDELAQQAHAAGANWVRTEVSWRTLEPTQGNYNFGPFEGTLNRFLNTGFKPIVYFAHNPTWAANTRCGPVDTTDASKLQAFADTFGKLAAHFQEIELWAFSNEVDQSTGEDGVGAGCFGAHSVGGVNNNGVSDAKEYAIMLAAARKAIRAANPKAKLAMGAVAFDNFDVTSAKLSRPIKRNDKES